MGDNQVMRLQLSIIIQTTALLPKTIATSRLAHKAPILLW